MSHLNFSILPFIKRCIYSEVKSYSHIFEIHRGLFRFICIVFLHMRSQCCGVPKSLRTDLAFVRCFSSVSPHVFSQINSGSEIIFTDGTLERFFAGVDSMMDFQEMFRTQHLVTNIAFEREICGFLFLHTVSF